MSQHLLFKSPDFFQSKTSENPLNVPLKTPSLLPETQLERLPSSHEKNSWFLSPQKKKKTTAKRPHNCWNDRVETVDLHIVSNTQTLICCLAAILHNRPTSCWENSAHRSRMLMWDVQMWIFLCLNVQICDFQRLFLLQSGCSLIETEQQVYFLAVKWEFLWPNVHVKKTKHHPTRRTSPFSQAFIGPVRSDMSVSGDWFRGESNPPPWKSLRVEAMSAWRWKPSWQFCLISGKSWDPGREERKELMQPAWESCDCLVQIHPNVGVFYWGRP